MKVVDANDQRSVSASRGRSLGRTRKTIKKNNAAGRPTVAELERRKAEVMRVATELFLREGYAATSLVNIARRAGVATRTLYQHFGDKDAIFRCVMFAPEGAAVFPPPDVSDGDSLFDVMMRAADYACEVTFRPTTVDMMRLAIAESKRFPDMMDTLVNESHAQFNLNVKSMFDELVARGFVEDGDTAAASEMFVHFILGDTPLLIFGGWKPLLPTREQLETKVDVYILGRWGPAVVQTARRARVQCGRVVSS